MQHIPFHIRRDRSAPMRATALGFATEYAAAIKSSGDGTMSAQDIVNMASAFLAFLTDDAEPTEMDAGMDVVQQDGAVSFDQVFNQAPVQPASDQPAAVGSAPVQPAPSAQPVEPPPAAPPPPPEAPVPEQPAPATDQPVVPGA